MGFLIPSALALAALAIPIIILYMLKLRRQPARVSSLFLWQQVLEDRQANAPWQRLKRNILLLLQLLILALLVMALARPYFTVEAKVQGNVVLLLDASASMQATDVAPNRFAAAQEAVRGVIDRLDPGNAVALIAVAHTPQILTAATTDRNQLRQALAAAEAGNGPADWEAALALAAAHAATLPDTTIVIVGDGALEDEVLGDNNAAERALPHLAAPVEFIPIGQSAANQGLVALSLRDGAAGAELFLRVANAASEPSRRLVEIYIDDQLFDARQLDIPARNSIGLTLSDLPLNGRQIRASLAGSDQLTLDDSAWLVRSGAPARVLLVSEGNLFLQRALALLPDVEIQRADPGQDLPRASFDLVIFDRTLPPSSDTSTDALPESNLLFIAPPGSTALFEVNGNIERPRVTRLDRRHPLLGYVELNSLNIAQAQAVTPPPWAQTVIEAQNGPLLLAGQAAGRRVAVLTFDLFRSDLPLQIDFPILMVNLARWLLPGEKLEQGQSLQVGQNFALPAVASADALLVETPNRDQFTFAPNQVNFNHTAEPGIYRVFAQEPDRNEPTFLTEFAVNLLAETETDIRPRQIQEVGPTGSASELQLLGRQEWWQPLVVLGLLVLLIEWWVYWRGEVR